MSLVGWGGVGVRGGGGCVAKVPCILHYWIVHLILAYSWARLAIIVAGKGSEECFYFFCFFPFIPVPSDFHLLYYLFSPFLLETTQNDPQRLTCR